MSTLIAVQFLRRGDYLSPGRLWLLVGVVALGDLAEGELPAAERVLVEVSRSPKTLAHGG